MIQALWKRFAEWLGFARDVPLNKAAVQKVTSSEAPVARAPTAHPEIKQTSAQTAQDLSTIKPSPPAPPPKQYEGTAFQIGAVERAKAKPFLFKDVGGRAVGPTPSQQSVIFSDAAATTVLAGAGSGKSTTLVQRVLFMRKVLGIDFSMMAVFTFTRKSREDFIRKLLEEAAQWGVPLGEKEAQRLVRTFHSKALQLSRGLLGKDEKIFEFLGKSAKKSASEVDATNDSPVENALEEVELLANDIDGFIELSSNDEQAELLKDIYAARYNKSANFRSAIYTLYVYTLLSQPLPKDDPKFSQMLKNLKWMSGYDEALCEHAETVWTKSGTWPTPGVTVRIPGDERFALDVMGEKFYANGYIESLDVHVVLGPCDGFDKVGELMKKRKVKPMPAIFGKRRALLAGCDRKIRFVRDLKDMQLLRMQLRYLQAKEELNAPAVMLRLPGEMPKVSFEALYEFGAFVETLGLRPNKLNEVLRGVNCSAVEQAAIAAVSEFFDEFYAELSKRGLITFNQIFAKLSDGSPELTKLSISDLIGVKHLMIDEFQDVSPLIVRFVRGVQGELLRKSKGLQRPTLMCVGDDWQSIYGWRGSSPQFLLNLKNYFPGAVGTPIQMEENFRSSQTIINGGEAFIEFVQERSLKRGIATNPSVMNVPHAIGATKDYNELDIKAALRSMLDNARADERVYVLAATHAELKPYKQMQDERLMCTTFHQSKGLEADYVILIGAPRYFGANDLKNALYAAGNFKQSFDAAQRDETFRVAYVAVTRAKKFCLWFAEPFPGSVIEAVPADGTYRLALPAGGAQAYVEQCMAKGNQQSAAA